MAILSLSTSGILLALSTAAFIGFALADRKSGEDRYRLFTTLSGVASMMFLFYFLANLLVSSGAWK